MAGSDANRVPAVYKQDGGDTLTVDSGGTFEALSGSTVTLAGSVALSGTLTPTGGVLSRVPEAMATSAAVTAADSGKTYYITAADVVASLPATAAGLTYTFIVNALSTTTGASISPVAADQIIGPGITAADDKDLINTAATDALGNFVTVVGNGTTGWVVTAMNGVWARQG